MARAAWLGACLTLLPSGADAQSHIRAGGATPQVAPTDDRYRDVERLLAAGLLPDVIFGHRPFSAAEFSRLANLGDSTLSALRRQAAAAGAPDAARQRVERLRWADAAIARLAAIGTAGRPLAERGVPVTSGGSAEVLLLHSSAPTRQVVYRGIGRSSGIIGSAIEHRGGLLVNEGMLAMGDLGLWAASGPLAISGRARARAGADDPFRGDDTRALAVHALSARLVVKNAVLTVGRDQLHWAPGVVGGLALSTTPRPVDQVSLAMERPVRLPWLLRYAGPVRASAFLADLGPRQHFPNTRLSGYKVTILPHPRFELGSSILVQWGGRGSPEASTRDILRDHLPFLLSGGGGQIEVSNKLATLDGRLRLGNWAGGITIYGEAAVDDLDKERLIRGGVKEDGAQVVGIRIPALGADGRWDLTVEGRRTGYRFYNHHQFQSGYTVDGAIIGDPLGPNGSAVGVRVIRGLGETGGDGELELTLGAERRSMDRFRIVSDPFGFERVESHPAEWRQRAAIGWVGRRGSALTLRARIAGERITNWVGEEGVTRWGVVSEVGTSVRF